MDRDWLARRLDEGASYEEIAAEVGKHASTVAYWAKKHGLETCHGVTHHARGGIDRDVLAGYVEDGLTVREIAEETGFGFSTVRFWLKRHDLRTLPSVRREANRDPDRPQSVEMHCRVHGVTRHFKRGSGYRCGRCSSNHVSERRRRVKQMLVEEAGGSCVLCGYDRCVRALEFHHVDPASKRFSLSHRGLSRGIEILRAEAAKCVLLCSNCHAEVEAGVTDIPG
jgi:transposase